MLVQDCGAAASRRRQNFHALVKEIDPEHQSADRRPPRDRIPGPLHEGAAENGRSERQRHKQDDEQGVHVSDSFHDGCNDAHSTKNEERQVAAIIELYGIAAVENWPVRLVARDFIQDHADPDREKANRRAEELKFFHCRPVQPDTQPRWRREASQLAVKEQQAQCDATPIGPKSPEVQAARRSDRKKLLDSVTLLGYRLGTL